MYPQLVTVILAAQGWYKTPVEYGREIFGIGLYVTRVYSKRICGTEIYGRGLYGRGKYGTVVYDRRYIVQDFMAG